MKERKAVGIVAKCNYCGSTQRKVLYSYTFEPRACEVCAPRFFRNIDGRIFPVQYDSLEYNRLLSTLQPRVRENLGKKLDVIFNKSIARNMRIGVLGKRLRLVFETEYRRKYGFIVVEVDAVTGMIRTLMETDESKVLELGIKITNGLPIF